MKISGKKLHVQRCNLSSVIKGVGDGDILLAQSLIIVYLSLPSSP